MFGPEPFSTGAASAALAQRHERPRARLGRHAARDERRSHLRPADASRPCRRWPRRWRSASGSASRAAQFLEAFLTGFEVECKIAEAIHPNHYKKGFHSSGTDRHVRRDGGRRQAARRSTPTRSAHALAIAASMASGIRVNFGTMTKPLHVGRAAQNGVMAAELAAQRLHRRQRRARSARGASSRCSATATASTPDRIVGKLGNPHTIVWPGRLDQAVSVRRARASDDGRHARGW